MINCNKIVLNAIKYIVYALCILYVLDGTKSTTFYLQKSMLIGSGMILIDYMIKNICRDIRENFDDQMTTPMTTPTEMTTTPMTTPTEMTTTPMTTPTEMTTTPMTTPTERTLTTSESETIKTDEQFKNRQIELGEQKIEYGYSFVHPSAMKLPEIRIPKCIQDTAPCNVCPIMMGGTADLLQVK